MNYDEIISELRNTMDRAKREMMRQKRKLISGSNDWITAHYTGKDGRYVRRKNPLNLSDVHKSNERRARSLHRHMSKIQDSRKRVKNVSSHIGGQSFINKISDKSHNRTSNYTSTVARSKAANKTQTGDTTIPKKKLGITPEKANKPKPSRVRPRPITDPTNKPIRSTSSSSSSVKKDPTIKTSVKSAKANSGVSRFRSSGQKNKYRA